SGAATTDGAARGAGLAIVAGVFGPGLGAALGSAGGGRGGGRCPYEKRRAPHDPFYAIWQEGLAAEENALKGSQRLTGTGPVASATDLEAELIAVVQADAKGKIAKSATELHTKVAARCANAATSIAQMFPGGCSASATLDALASCAATVARGQL